MTTTLIWCTNTQHSSLSPLPHYTTNSIIAKIQIVDDTFQEHFIQALTINKSGT